MSPTARSPAKLPTTPILASAEIPTHAMAESALTPPPSAQGPLPNVTGVANMRSPPSTFRRLDRKLTAEDEAYSKMTPGEIEMMPVGELRRTVARFAAIAQEAKTTAAHYKLQHQMSQMESGEAVERMAVEMEMARREIEVLQQAEAQRQIQQQRQRAMLSPAESDPDFRRVHKDTYTAMLDEIMSLKTENARLEMDVNDAHKVISQQETEIASLNDRVTLMRERMQESRFRRAGLTESPRTVRATPLQTPSRSNIKSETTPRQQGFDALLQATDIITQRAERDSRRQVPSTPQPKRAPRLADDFPLYTPQPPRRQPFDRPVMTPMSRKRSVDVLYKQSNDMHQGHESDGTLSAITDSEAETEIADNDYNDDPFIAPTSARAKVTSPAIRKAKSAFNVRTMTQTRLFGNVQKPSADHEAVEHRQAKRTRINADLRPDNVPAPVASA